MQFIRADFAELTERFEHFMNTRDGFVGVWEVKTFTGSLQRGQTSCCRSDCNSLLTRMFDEAEDIFLVRRMAAKASIYSVGSTKGPLCGKEDVTAQCRKAGSDRSLKSRKWPLSAKQDVTALWKARRDPNKADIHTYKSVITTWSGNNNLIHHRKQYRLQHSHHYNTHMTQIHRIAYRYYRY